MEIEILSKSQYFLKKDNCCEKKITTFTFWQSCILHVCSFLLSAVYSGLFPFYFQCVPVGNSSF